MLKSIKRNIEWVSMKMETHVKKEGMFIVLLQEYMVCQKSEMFSARDKDFCRGIWISEMGE